MTVPAPLFMRKWAAVMEAAAFVSDVIAFAVAVARPLLVALVEAGNAVALIVSVAPSVPLSAVNVVAGGEPERMYRWPVPPPLTSAVMASSAAFAAMMEVTGVVVILHS
jgi:hypothetical protein